jgi:hypothetical protein
MKSKQEEGRFLAVDSTNTAYLLYAATERQVKWLTFDKKKKNVKITRPTLTGSNSKNILSAK